MKASGDAAIERLLSVGTGSLGPTPSSKPTLFEPFPLGEELFGMLQRRNGFYAFESALHVFPIQSPDCMSLEEWNSDDHWRRGYGDLASGLLFFAEDVFQDQFCLSSAGVQRFDAETGATKHLADSIENWARRILDDYPQETGWPLAAKWQAVNGPLLAGTRLLPKTPFFLGGSFSLDNLWASDAVEGMRFKADLAMQTRDLPDGASVRLVVGRKPYTQ